SPGSPVSTRARVDGEPGDHQGDGDPPPAPGRADGAPRGDGWAAPRRGGGRPRAQRPGAPRVQTKVRTAAFLERLPALPHWRRLSTQTTWVSTRGSATPKWRGRVLGALARRELVCQGAA